MIGSEERKEKKGLKRWEWYNNNNIPNCKGKESVTMFNKNI